MNIRGGNGFGKQTQTAGTLISYLIPPLSGAYTRLKKLVYTAQGTAHTITVCRTIGTRVKLTSGASTGQAVVNISADPGSGISNAIAANDWCAMRHDDGVYRLHKVSSVSTLAITMTANMPAVASANQPFWFFGLIADTDPNIGTAHGSLRGVASQTTTYEDAVDGGGLFASHNTFEPLLVQSNNASADGTIEHLTWNWTY